MKFHRNTKYLNPILNNQFLNTGDYTSGNFELSAKFSVNKDNFDFDIELILSQSDIETLLKNYPEEERGLTGFVIISCSETFFRYYEEVNLNKKHTISLPKKNFHTKFSIQAYIYCKQEIYGYQPNDINDDYKDLSGVFSPIDIKKGRLLGISNRISRKLNNESGDEWLQMVRAKISDDQVLIDYDGPILNVSISEDMFAKYQENEKLPLGKKTLKRSLFLSVFVEVLNQMYPCGFEKYEDFLDENSAYNSEEIFPDWKNISSQAWFNSIHKRVCSLSASNEFDQNNLLIATKLTNESLDHLYFDDLDDDPQEYEDTEG